MKNKIINLFNKTTPKTAVEPYSKLLEKLIVQFENEFKDFDYMDDIFNFGSNAWNLANLRCIAPNEIDRSDLIFDVENKNRALLDKLIEYKIIHFSSYTNFIIDFEIEGKNNENILTVVTQTQEVFLSNFIREMEEEMEEEIEASDLDESYIDRQSIILKPQQPFIDWAKNLPDDECFFDKTGIIVNTYLIDEDIIAEKWLKKKFDKLFMLELEEICQNKKLWPNKRNYKMFREWFRVEFSELVFDLERRKVTKI
jgi:hypothetical protein